MEGPVFYSALIREDKMAKSLEEPSWDLRIGDGGPGFSFRYEDGKEIGSYYRHSDEGVEPFVFPATALIALGIRGLPTSSYRPVSCKVFCAGVVSRVGVTILIWKHMPRPFRTHAVHSRLKREKEPEHRR